MLSTEMSASDRTCSFRIVLSRHLTPQPNVGNSLLVARDHDFGSFGDGAAVLAARATDAARARLRIQNLARFAFADGNAESAEDSHHLVVRGGPVLLGR